MKRIQLLAFVLLGIHNPAWGHFRVEPLKIQLPAEQKMATMSITNESQERRYIQASALSWEQDDNNKDSENESTDLMIFPTTLSLDPGEKKDIQIKRRHEAPQDIEKAYRIFLKEIPQEKNKAPMGITLLVNVKAAFYVKPQRRDTIQNPTCKIVKMDDKPALECANPNNEHVVLQNVKYTKDDKEELLNVATGILAHKKKTTDVSQIPEEALAGCRVEFMVNGQTLSVNPS